MAFRIVRGGQVPTPREIALRDLPRLEDVPRLPPRIARIDFHAASAYDAAVVAFLRKFYDALQRMMAEERSAIRALPEAPPAVVEPTVCPDPLRLFEHVARIDVTTHTLPHGIGDVGETAEGWELYVTGLFVGDTYQIQVEYDNGAIEDPTFVATGTEQSVTGLYPPGATRLRRVEFAVYPLPVVMTGQAWRGFGARAIATEFYDVLEALGN